MSAQRLALQTLKSIEATSKTRSAFKFSRVSNLAKLVRVLGYGFLLFDLSPVAAQTLAAVENKGGASHDLPSVKETMPKVALREYSGLTMQTYLTRKGVVKDVYPATDGRFYIVRSNGRKFFPKSLNKSTK